MKNASPLAGIKVVELGSAISGPLCTMVLAEMGAEVIKVENTEKGDDSRSMGRPLKGESLYFVHYNKNKRSIAVNLKKPQGLRIVKQLVKKSDVLVENFRPGVLEKYGLSFDKVKKLNPSIIYCSVTGFGSQGPLKDYKGYDLVVQAMTGLMWMNRKPSDEPMRTPIPITDILAAFLASTAICAALYRRQITKKAVKIDVSLFMAGVAAMGQWISTEANSGQIVEPFGNRYPAIAPYEPFRAKDGWLVVAVGNQEQWSRFCEVIGRRDLLEDPRFSSNQSRINPVNRDALANEISEVLSRETVSHWVNLLQQSGVPAGPVNSIHDLLTNNFLHETGLFSQVLHPILGKLLAVRTAPMFDQKFGPLQHAPLHGQHTEEILKELGYSSKMINRLVVQGVVKTYNNSLKGR